MRFRDARIRIETKTKTIFNDPFSARCAIRDAEKSGETRYVRAGTLHNNVFVGVRRRAPERYSNRGVSRVEVRTAVR